MHPPRSLVIALALAAACLLAVPARAGEADDHFVKGNDAFQAEKFDLALTEYQAAWKLTKSYDVAALLGLTEMRLNKYRDAAEHLSYALAHFAPSGDEDLRKNTAAALAEVKKVVVTVRLKSTTKDITFKVGGAAIDPASLDTDIYFEPGKREIIATAPGHITAKRTIAGKQGDSELVTMNLSPEPAAARSLVPPIVLGGVALAGVIVGGALVGTAEGKKTEAIALHDDIAKTAGSDKRACLNNPALADKCKALSDAASATDALGNGGIAAFVFAGVAGLAAGGYMLLPSRKAPSAKAAVVPVIAPGAGGLVLTGAF